MKTATEIQADGKSAEDFTSEGGYVNESQKGLRLF
jgi:hypothetical protein